MFERDEVDPLHLDGAHQLHPPLLKPLRLRPHRLQNLENITPFLGSDGYTCVVSIYIPSAAGPLSRPAGARGDGAGGSDR